MNLKELYEGATPKLPGAAKGIQIMTPQQFIAKSAAGEEPGSEVDEGIAGAIAGGALGAYAGKTPAAAMTGASMGSEVQDLLSSSGVMGVTPQSLGLSEDKMADYSKYPTKVIIKAISDLNKSKEKNPELIKLFTKELFRRRQEQGLAEGKGKPTCGCGSECKHCSGKHSLKEVGKKCSCCGNMIKLSMSEATALPASTRELKGQELTDYLDRIRNQDKKKTDKYNLPYVHRSSVVGYYNAEGKKYDTDAIKKGLAQKPEKLLKKNEKMKHSDGAQEQFFNIGFAALVGIALDENTNELIVVNTCPGAGSCKVDCFAMKGGKVQFAGPWLSDGRILTYLLNHPGEFFNQLTQEITKEVAKGQKGGYSVSIRWHDAGDFFSPEYMDMAFKLAQSLPGVRFYAYTKVAAAAMAGKPANFIINWSEGASTGQEKQIKRTDPNLDKTKNSRIVPSSLFYDLLVKDSKKNLVKGPAGQWQVIPDELPELKQRLADKYNISKNSILSYDEWNTKGKNNKSMKWNVIVAPGEPDLTANDPGVLSTLLLKH
jgi:Gene product 88